ncbi:hypothetical protein PGTUg99_035877 [Puccinia graminis f. sp. tritici]|uniref:Uncharacterized protein n=1 Tax=Puccinia graminis f. sp. tritici TaxID=56615 RepID=A0A5B0SJ44_PUCGR|nr:hypothetical protein PGTUg99_035877 [Puccinia graminis f. sp. tritici]
MRMDTLESRWHHPRGFLYHQPYLRGLAHQTGTQGNAALTAFFAIPYDSHMTIGHS